MLTEKAEQTRLQILETALGLFHEHGYENTTMREIAQAADCSLGLTYRYFARKEDLVLALYTRMATETNAQIAQLPPETLAKRFYATMTTRLQHATPYRDSIGALFGAVINPQSGVSLFGETTQDLRQQTLEAFYLLVNEAKDSPAQAQQVESLAVVLYSLHFAIILFWLLDPSPNQTITAQLLRFIRDSFGIPLRMLALPPLAASLVQFAELLKPVFVR